MNYQALAGAVARATGDADGPAIPRVPIADLAAATVAALAHLRGVGEALQTGEGERIDVAMADVVASWIGPHAGTAHRDGRRTDARLTRLRRVPLRRRRVPHARGDLRGPLLDGGVRRPGDRRAARPALRAASRAVEECNAAVAAAVARLDRDAAIARLAAAGAPVAPVLTPSETGSNPQFRAREVFVDDDGDTRTAFPGRLRVHPVRPPGPAPEPDSA